MKNKIALLLASLITAASIASMAPTAAMANTATSTKVSKLQVVSCKSGFHSAQDSFVYNAAGDPNLTVTFTGTWCTNGKTVATKPAPYFNFSGVCSGMTGLVAGCDWKEVSQTGAWNSKIKAFLVNEQTAMKVGSNITLPNVGSFMAGYGSNSYLFQIGMSPKGYFVNIKGNKLPTQMNK